jgi:hypothetical protein
MANNIVQRSHDWLQSPHTNLLAWWIPWIAVIAGLHARPYTGPYYLAMSIISR